MSTAPLIETTPAKPSAPQPSMTESERRVIEKLRLLRSQNKRAMLLVRWDGPALTLWRIVPDGLVLEG